MDSNKSTLLIVALAIIGAIIFSQVLILPPAVTYVIGVAVTAVILKFSRSPVSTDEEDKLSTKTLYVGNLPYKANESTVRDLFQQYGEVFAVRLMKDKRTGKRRGFGFVVMAADQAQYAIDNLNEKEYMQRTLKVRIANAPKHLDSDTAEQD